MDIKNLAAIVEQDEQVADIPIYQKNGEPYTALDGKTQSTVGVLGTESREYRKAKDAISREHLRTRRATLTPEDIRANRVRLAAAVVKRWNGWDDGKTELPLTPENLNQLLAVDHILEQVEEGRESHARFFTNASAKPVST